MTFIHFEHSKGKPLTLTIKGTTSPQDCPLQIMKAYLSMRGAAAGPLFLYCPSVPVTRAKFNEQLRGALQFCHFCPKQFKSHSFRIGAATTTAAQGMSDSQIRSLVDGPLMPSWSTYDVPRGCLPYEPPAHHLVWVISKRYSRFGVQFSHLAFFWGQHFPPVQGQKCHGVVFPEKDSPGETIHSARRICFP